MGSVDGLWDCSVDIMMFSLLRSAIVRAWDGVRILEVESQSKWLLSATGWWMILWTPRRDISPLYGVHTTIYQCMRKRINCICIARSLGTEYKISQGFLGFATAVSLQELCRLTATARMLVRVRS